MKNILYFVIVLFITVTNVYANNKDEAIEAFNFYVKSANSYNPVIVEMYSPNAKIIRQVIKPDGTTQDVITDTATYIKQMKLGQAGAKLRHYSNSYSNVHATEISDGKIKVTSLRQPSTETYKLKTYMIFQKQSSGKWLIIEEMMQTKVQSLLKYAK